MSIPESSIVNVSVSVSQAAAAQAGFGLVAIFGTSTYLPTGSRYGLFSSLTDVAAVFPNNAPEYLAAQITFSRSPTPTQIMIARMLSAATAAELLGSLTPDTVLAHYTAIANGAISLSIDGVAENITAINLTGAASLPAVAALIQTAIDAVVAGVTVTYSGGRFIIRSGTTGAASTLTFCTVAPAGTDLAPLLKMRSTDGGILTQGAIAETVTQSLTNVQALFGDWYMFGLVGGPTDQNIEDAAAFALANGKIAGYVSSAAGVINSGVSNDVASVLQASTNKRVIGIFDLSGLNPYAIFSALAEAATVDFTGQDTTETLMFKQMPGVSVSAITNAMKQVLDTKSINYYASVGGNPMFMKGVMADGTFFDQVQGLDWLSAAIGAAVFNGFYGAKKVPQTDKGMATILHWIEGALAQGVRNGLLAPGIWNGTGIGQIKTGDYLAKGYYAWADSVDNQQQSVRNTRVAPPVTILAKGAGALQGINIMINFQQ